MTPTPSPSDATDADRLPREVRRGTMKIGDLEITVIHLDDGRRVIPAEDMERFLSALTGEAGAEDGR